MTTMKKQNRSDVGRMIRTLCLLAFAVILKSYATDTFSLIGSTLIIGVIVIVFAINNCGGEQSGWMRDRFSD